MNDLETLKQQFTRNCKTQSNNPCVIAVYKVILENENSDSDYWNEDFGSQELIQIFENSYTVNDWKDLEFDLNNWTNFQIELFTQAILGGYSSFTNNGIYYSEKETVKELTKTISNRFDLLFAILNIEVERKLEYLDFSNKIIENLDFINDHFDVLLEVNPDYLMKIQNILSLLNLSESNFGTVFNIKEKISKASR